MARCAARRRGSVSSQGIGEGRHRLAIHDAMVAPLMRTSTSAPRPTPTMIDIGVATRARKGQR
jgi:hypothetical protein